MSLTRPKEYSGCLLGGVILPSAIFATFAPSLYTPMLFAPEGAVFWGIKCLYLYAIQSPPYVISSLTVTITSSLLYPLIKVPLKRILLTVEVMLESVMV